MLNQNSTMNVMYASDDNYAEIMGVSILSLLQSNKDVQKIRIYIIEDAISESNKNNLVNMIHLGVRLCSSRCRIYEMIWG